MKHRVLRPGSDAFASRKTSERPLGQSLRVRSWKALSFLSGPHGGQLWMLRSHALDSLQRAQCSDPPTAP